VLLVEDSENDAMLLLRELRRGGYEPLPERVYTPEGMQNALDAAEAGGEPFQVVISDYYMPRFRAPEALELLRELDPDIPFIVVSGKIGEDAAVEVMKAGADDYLTKENMSRLCPAIERELREAEVSRERERAERALSKSENRFKRLVEQAADAIFVHDLEGNFVDVNPQACESLGYSREELLGLSVPDVETEYAPGSLRKLWAQISSGRPRTLEGTHRRKDGSTFPVEIRVGVFEAEVRPLMLALVRDVSGRKEAEEKIRETEDRYRTLVEQIPAVTYVQEPIESDNPKSITYMSPQYETMLGYPADAEIVDEEHWLRMLHPGDRDRVLAEELRTDETGEPFRVEYRLIARDGRVVWVRDEATLLRDQDGNPLYWLGVQYDVSEQKRAEEEFGKSEARFRATFEQAAVGILQVGLDGGWLRFNDKFCDIVGYAREELVTASIFSLISPEDFDRDFERGVSMLAGELRDYTEEKLIIGKGGRRVWINLTVSLVHDESDEPRYFIAIIEDIGKRKQAEKDLEQSEALYRTVVEQAAENIFLVDAKSRRVLEANEALLSSLGYTGEELEGLTLYDIVAHDQESVDLNIGRIMEEGTAHLGERQYRRKNGSLADVEVNVSAVPYNGETVMCVVAHDVTQRKRAESMLEEIREAERNRIARELHDSTLQDIVYALQEIQVMQVVTGEESDPALEDTAEALRRSVEGLRGAIFELRLKEALDRSLVSSLESLVDLNRRMSRGKYELELVVADDFPTNLPDKLVREITRIVQESLTNVRRHSGASHAKVELRLEGELAHVEVSDDGRGFDPEGARTGIGRQSMGHRALELDGDLSVRSAPGGGTQVRLSIPLSRLDPK
jgi:PAS domain S-box-containing protein